MWHDNETTQDLIGFQRIAKTIASLLTDKNILPVTVGLFGDWGSGKSSILRMVEQEISKADSVLILRFDGWLFEGYDDAKAALMTAIIDCLTKHIEGNKALWEKLKPKAMSLLRRINWFRAVGLAAKGILTLTSPAGAAVVAGLSISDAISFVAGQAKDPEALEKSIKGLVKDEPTTTKDMHETIREFRDEFQSLVQESSISTLAVLIDDLDRCLPESIVSTLEAIKLFLSVPGTAFVIAADERIVSQAIARRYPPENYKEFDIAQEYLDKLVQIPCIIPPMDVIETETYIYLLFAQKELQPEQFEKLYATVQENRINPSVAQPLNYGIAKSCIGDAARALEADFAIAGRIAPILARHLGGNPRLVKRFLNTFSLRIRLARSEKIDLNHGLLVKIMVLERFHKDMFEELYRWQIEQDGIPAQIEKLEKAVSGENETSDSADESYFKSWLDDPSLREWLRMEPLLFEKNLAPYFYLARESLKMKLAVGRRLSQRQQELFASLQSGSRAVQQRSANDLAGSSDDEIYPIYDALWTRFEANPRELKVINGLLELAYLHEGVAGKLVESLSKLSPANIDSELVPRVAKIRQQHKRLGDRVNTLINEWALSSNKRLQKAAQAVIKVPQRKS